MVNDPRVDMNRISAELIKLEGKRIDLESTRSKLNDDLNDIESQNKALEVAIGSKKNELMQSTSNKQDTLRDAHSQVEFQIASCKKEQAELKAKINELLRMNEEVTK